MVEASHRLTWEELCADRSLHDLPYQIELNGLNQIVMTPRPFRHGRCRVRIAGLLSDLLPHGMCSFNAAVPTADNFKVPDVIWAPREFFRAHMDACALPVMPDLCVEVLVPTNTRAEMDQKRALYFESGAREVWLCGLEGEMEFFAPAGKLEHSALCPEFPARVEL